MKEGVIINDDSCSHEKFVHGLKVLMAKNYIDNLSEEVKKGMNQKASNGDWPCRPPLGYKRDTITHKVEIDTEAAPMVVRLFEAYASGHYSLRQLIDFAGKIGLRTSRGYRLNKAGIHRILGNIFYLGRFVYKGKLFENALHKPIIELDLFNCVQKRLRHPEKARVSKREFAFRGLLTCHACGCSMTPDLKMGKYLYYRCTEFRGRCKNSVSEPILAEKLTEIMARIKISPETAEALKIGLHESHQDKVRFHEEAMTSLERQRRELRRRMDQAYNDKLDGVISDSYWKQKSSEWNTDLVKIDSDMASHRVANLNYLDLGQKIISLASQSYELFLKQDNYEKRKLLNSIVSKILFGDGTLYPIYRKPFDLLADSSISIMKRGLRDEFRNWVINAA